MFTKTAMERCRCVVKITSADKVSTVFKSEQPRNPARVGLREGDVYVREWTHANAAGGGEVFVDFLHLSDNSNALLRYASEHENR